MTGVPLCGRVWLGREVLRLSVFLLAAQIPVFIYVDVPDFQFKSHVDVMALSAEHHEKLLFLP
jgi:hypothetical protein